MRVEPVSRRMNPPCISRTRMNESITQSEFRPMFNVAAEGSSANAITGNNKVKIPKANIVFLINTTTP